MTEEYAESLYGPNPEGDAPQGEDLVTDPGDLPSYNPLDAALEVLSHTRGGIQYTKKTEGLDTTDHPVLNPTPQSPGRIELEALLRSAINLPAHPSDDELDEALGTAASVLWGAGYRRILQ